jgi:hypothetical protein
MKRAVVAAFGWPANRQEDAVYPYTEVDSTGQRLDGVRLANDEKRLAGALFIASALRHVEDAIPAPTSKRSRSG